MGRPLQSTWEVKKWLAQLFSEAAQSEDPTNMAITFICSQVSTTKNLIKALAATLHNELNDGRKCSDYILVQVDSPFEPTSNFTMAWAWLVIYIFIKLISFCFLYMYVIHSSISHKMQQVKSGIFLLAAMH